MEEITGREVFPAGYFMLFCNTMSVTSSYGKKLKRTLREKFKLFMSHLHIPDKSLCEQLCLVCWFQTLFSHLTSLQWQDWGFFSASLCPSKTKCVSTSPLRRRCDVTEGGKPFFNDLFTKDGAEDVRCLCYPKSFPWASLYRTGLGK